MPAFDTLTLETPRLLLRPLRATDVQALFGIFSDPTVMRYWSSTPWTGIEPALAMVERDRTAMANGEHLRLGIERSADGRLLGMCTLFAFNAVNRRADVGYCQGLENWGHGYMDEALRALLAHGFGTLDLNRVEADVDPRNAGSVRTLERLGFVREGLLRERWIVAGERSDTAFYGLIRSDWRP